jgi:hypothetical protein
LREDVLAYLAKRAPADIVAAQQIYVTGPEYQPIDVEATLVPVDLSAAGQVTQSASAALKLFLHPLLGGPEGIGWPPNRAVYLSDVAVALRNVPGLDQVQELALLQDGVPHGEFVNVTGGRIVAAGDIRLKVVPGKQGP